MAIRFNLHASGAETATGIGTGIINQTGPTRIEFQLDVTALATVAGDTFDLFVQTQIDSTNWIDIVHFTQILGNGATVRRVAHIHSQVAVAEYATSAALGAAAVRNTLGVDYRARWDIAGATPSFTFSLDAIMGFS